MPTATGIALLLFAVVAAICLYAMNNIIPPKQPEVIQITQAQLTAVPVPKPPPPPPPKVVPPPKPLPVTIPKPPPIPSKIVVATKPPPPVHHVIKHIPKPIPHVEQPTPPPVVQPPTPTPPQVAAPRTDGIGPYGSAMHSIIEQNQDVPPALAQLGVSGTAVVSVEVAPDGSVVSASIVRSSGVSLIDETALDHVRSAHFPPFNADMPNQTQRFTVPVEIDGEDAQQ
jgi:protein TonB